MMVESVKKKSHSSKYDMEINAMLQKNGVRKEQKLCNNPPSQQSSWSSFEDAEGIEKC